MQDPLPVGSITPEQFSRMRAIFEAALDLPLAGRRAWLADACGGDALLAERVERMLAAADQRHHFLDHIPDHGDDETREAVSLACRACGTALQASHQFCPSCGTPSNDVDPLHEGRFRTGALFAARFRVLGLQGRGGMGHVYRAQDLELGQPVALKFLPTLQSNRRARSRLRTEVRLARQISHPNVCRVYDIGEANGELYLSMEYVDGEDLAALFKRIGRLPVHKGVDIARKLCAGLAAAHARGVLHKDLKPSNIMIDSRGEVRIMDFGLAAVAEEHLDAVEISSGTPAYMAPEQLEGREATVRSDIYALGLVLFELFTARPAFEGTDAADFLRLRGSHPSTTPTTLVRDLDPAIERTILKCLEPDPRLRPASALEVAASLPGGDLIAEALAAGETPSPDVVAAAGADIVMRPAIATALLVVVGAALTGVLLLTEQTQIVSMVPMENSPEVLASKARDFVRSLGYTASDPHVAYGFRDERGYRDHVAATISPGDDRLRQWKRTLKARPAPVSFWYAHSDGPLVPPGATSGTARPLDSLPAVRDAVSVDLDLDGRLLRFVASPATPQHSQGGATTPTAVDWQRYFSAAGLDMAVFSATDPRPGPSADPQARLAWAGSYPGRSDLPVRVEGTTTAATVTSFEVLFPWTNREPMLPERTNYWAAALLIIIWTVPCLVARFNWRRGRADLRGALRLGTVAFLAHLASLLLNADDALNAFITRPIFWVALGLGVWTVAVYLALEPWVRRWWPHAMLGWARVVAGRWRDPIVGRDVLVALAVITVYRCVYLAAVVGTVHDGAPPLNVASINTVPGEFVLSNIAGPQFVAANMLSSVTFGIATAAVSFFLLALFRSLLWNQWLGIAVFCAFTYLWSSMLPDFRGGWLMMSTHALLLAIWIFGALRYGLLTLVIATSVYQVMAQSMLGTHFSEWYGRSSLIVFLLVSTLAIWAFRVSIGSRPLWPSAR